MKYFLHLLLLVLVSSSMSQGQSLGIGTDFPNPHSIMDITSTSKGVLLPRLTIAQRDLNITPSLTTTEEGLLIYCTDELAFNYWDGSQWISFPNAGIMTADNGLNLVADEVRLGGDLIQNTVITHGNYSLSHDLTGTGNFYISASGVGTKFQVRNDGLVSVGSANMQGDFNVTGESYFSDDLYLRDGAVNSGDILGKWYDDNDDGVFELNQNNNINIRLHANGETVFNERASAIDFRVETQLKKYGLVVDGDMNIVRIGNNDSGEIQYNTNSIFGDWTGVTLDYVADFQTTGTNAGTTVGIGTREFIFDAGSDELATNASIYPVYHLTQDIGRDSMLAWDDVYADAFIMASDTRLKKDIRDIEYGLDEILKIKAVSYTRIDDPFKERKLGVLAQQTLPLIKEVVKTHDHRLVDENSLKYEEYELPFMGVEYLQFVPVLIKGMQEQQELIKKQDKKIEKLVKMFHIMNERMEQLEAQID